MEQRTKIVIASPREPCGATWLINCFLELGILTYRKSAENMWRRESGRFFLRSQENILKKWLPSLYHHDAFFFRSDIEVEWSHEWPTNRFLDCQVIYFYRDPRDALYSRYKREAATLPLSEYLSILEPNTLLDRVESNWLHMQFWMQHPNIRLFRFEDYKKDPELTLRNILDYIGVKATDKVILDALDASTGGKAKEVEDIFNANDSLNLQHGEACQVVNQGGVVGRWQELKGEDHEAITRVEQFCGAMLHKLGYRVENQTGQCDVASYAEHLRGLSSFKKIEAYPSGAGTSTEQKVASLENRVFDFSKKLTVEMLKGAGMTKREENVFLSSLADYSAFKDKDAFNNVKNISRHFVGDSEFYFNLFKRSGKMVWLPKIGAPFMLMKSIELSKAQLVKISRYLKRRLMPWSMV